MTTEQFNKNVRSAIAEKMARAASESKAARLFNLSVAETLLDRAATAQKTYWDSLSALEKELGFEIDTEELGELDAYSVRDLYNRFA